MKKKKRAKNRANASPADSPNATAPTPPPAAPTAEAVAPPPTATWPVRLRGLLRNLARRRTTWLVLGCLVVGIAFTLIQNSNAFRPGVIEYSSDDPAAHVIAEKDGEETVLTGSKEQKKLAPGHYTFRFNGPSNGLKLWPTTTNLAPGGLSFVYVKSEHKSP